MASDFFRESDINDRKNRFQRLRNECEDDPDLAVKLCSSTSSYEQFLGVRALRWQFNESVCADIARRGDSPRLRSAAIHLLAGRKDNDRLIDSVFSLIGMRSRTVLLKSLMRHRRETLASKLVLTLRGAGRHHLLYLGDLECLTDELKTCARSMERWQWRRLCKSRPQIALRCLAVIARSPDASSEWVAGFTNDLMARLPKRVETAGLESVLRQLSVNHSLEKLCGEACSPKLLLRLLQENEDDQSDWAVYERIVIKSELEGAAALTGEELQELAGLGKSMTSQLLDKESSRRKWVPLLYPYLRYEWRYHDAELADIYLIALPRKVRHLETRRILALPHMITRDAVRISYQAFLPWDEVIGDIRHFLKDPEIGTRCAAHQALGTLCLLDPPRLTDVLEMQRNSMREISGVRNELLAALRRQPVSRFRSAHEAAVNEIVQKSLEAKDLDWCGREHLQALALRFYQVWPDTSLRWIRESPSESLNLPSVGDSSQSKHMAALLMKSAANKTGSEWLDLVFQMLGSIGSDLQLCPEIVDSIFDRLSEFDLSSNRWALGRILLALRWGAPAHFSQCVCNLVRKDSTWLCFSPVARAVATSESGLLLPWLNSKGLINGSFNTKDDCWFAPIPFACLAKLPPHIQSRFNQFLIEYAQETPRPDKEIAGLLRYSSHLDEIPLRETLLGEVIAGRAKSFCADEAFNLRSFAVRMLVRSGRYCARELLDAHEDKVALLRLTTKCFESDCDHLLGSLTPSDAVALPKYAVTTSLIERMAGCFDSAAEADKGFIVTICGCYPELAACQTLFDRMASPLHTRVLKALLSFPKHVAPPRKYQELLSVACEHESSRVVSRAIRWIKNHGHLHLFDSSLLSVILGEKKLLRKEAIKTLLTPPYSLCSSSALKGLFEGFDGDVSMLVNTVTTFLSASLLSTTSKGKKKADEIAEAMLGCISHRYDLIYLQLQLVFSLSRAEAIAEKLDQTLGRVSEERALGRSVFVAALRHSIGCVTKTRKLPRGTVTALKNISAKSDEVKIAAFLALCSEQGAYTSGAAVTWTIPNIMRLYKYKKSDHPILAACAQGVKLPCSRCR